MKISAVKEEPKEGLLYLCSGNKDSQMFYEEGNYFQHWPQGHLQCISVCNTKCRYNRAP